MSEGIPDGWTDATWMLQNGIAPWQAFLIRFGEPEYSGGSYWEPSDIDVDFEVELVRVMPWKPESVVRRWGKFFREREAHIA